jgi:hypothetical protein
MRGMAAIQRSAQNKTPEEFPAVFLDAMKNVEDVNVDEKTRTATYKGMKLSLQRVAGKLMVVANGSEPPAQLRRLSQEICDKLQASAGRGSTDVAGGAEMSGTGIGGALLRREDNSIFVKDTDGNEIEIEFPAPPENNSIVKLHHSELESLELGKLTSEMGKLKQEIAEKQAQANKPEANKSELEQQIADLQKKVADLEKKIESKGQSFTLDPVKLRDFSSAEHRFSERLQRLRTDDASQMQYHLLVQSSGTESPTGDNIKATGINADTLEKIIDFMELPLETPGEDSSDSGKVLEQFASLEGATGGRAERKNVRRHAFEQGKAALCNQLGSENGDLLLRAVKMAGGDLGAAKQIYEELGGTWPKGGEGGKLGEAALLSMAEDLFFISKPLNPGNLESVKAMVNLTANQHPGTPIAVRTEKDGTTVHVGYSEKAKLHPEDKALPANAFTLIAPGAKGNEKGENWKLVSPPKTSAGDARPKGMSDGLRNWIGSNGKQGRALWALFEAVGKGKEGVATLKRRGIISADGTPTPVGKNLLQAIASTANEDQRAALIRLAVAAGSSDTGSDALNALFAESVDSAKLGELLGLVTGNGDAFQAVTGELKSGKKPTIDQLIKVARNPASASPAKKPGSGGSGGLGGAGGPPPAPVGTPPPGSGGTGGPPPATPPKKKPDAGDPDAASDPKKKAAKKSGADADAAPLEEGAPDAADPDAASDPKKKAAKKSGEDADAAPLEEGAPDAADPDARKKVRNKVIGGATITAAPDAAPASPAANPGGSVLDSTDAGGGAAAPGSPKRKRRRKTPADPDPVTVARDSTPPSAASAPGAGGGNVDPSTAAPIHPDSAVPASGDTGGDTPSSTLPSAASAPASPAANPGGSVLDSTDAGGGAAAPGSPKRKRRRKKQKDPANPDAGKGGDTAAPVTVARDSTPPASGGDTGSTPPSAAPASVGGNVDPATGPDAGAGSGDTVLTSSGDSPASGDTGGDTPSSTLPSAASGGGAAGLGGTGGDTGSTPPSAAPASASGSGDSAATASTLVPGAGGGNVDPSTAAPIHPEAAAPVVGDAEDTGDPRVPGDMPENVRDFIQRHSGDGDWQGTAMQNLFNALGESEGDDEDDGASKTGKEALSRLVTGDNDPKLGELLGLIAGEDEGHTAALGRVVEALKSSDNPTVDDLIKAAGVDAGVDGGDAEDTVEEEAPGDADVDPRATDAGELHEGVEAAAPEPEEAAHPDGAVVDGDAAATGGLDAPRAGEDEPHEDADATVEGDAAATVEGADEGEPEAVPDAAPVVDGAALRRTAAPVVDDLDAPGGLNAGVEGAGGLGGLNAGGPEGAGGLGDPRAGDTGAGAPGDPRAGGPEGAGGLGDPRVPGEEEAPPVVPRDPADPRGTVAGGPDALRATVDGDAEIDDDEGAGGLGGPDALRDTVEEEAPGDADVDPRATDAGELHEGVEAAAPEPEEAGEPEAVLVLEPAPDTGEGDDLRGAAATDDDAPEIEGDGTVEGGDGDALRDTVEEEAPGDADVDPRATDAGELHEGVEAAAPVVVDATGEGAGAPGGLNAAAPVVVDAGGAGALGGLNAGGLRKPSDMSNELWEWIQVNSTGDNKRGAAMLNLFHAAGSAALEKAITKVDGKITLSNGLDHLLTAIANEDENSNQRAALLDLAWVNFDGLLGQFAEKSDIPPNLQNLLAAIVSKMNQRTILRERAETEVGEEQRNAVIEQARIERQRIAFVALAGKNFDGMLALFNGGPPQGLDNLLAAIAGKEEENPLQRAALRELAGRNLGGVLALFAGKSDIPPNLQHLLAAIAGKSGGQRTALLDLARVNLGSLLGLTWTSGLFGSTKERIPPGLDSLLTAIADKAGGQRTALLDLAGKNLSGLLGLTWTSGLFGSTKEIIPPGLDNLLAAIAGKDSDSPQRAALLDLAGATPGGVLKLFEKNATSERLDELLELITGDGKERARSAVIAALEKNASFSIDTLLGRDKLTIDTLMDAVDLAESSTP